MADNHFAFTKSTLTALQPTKTRVYYHDSQTPGLCLCVTPTGGKTFYYLKWMGKTVRVRIGGFPELTVDQARTLAKGHALTVAAGENPQERKQKKRGEPTLGELWKEYETYIDAHLKPKTVKDYKLQWNAYLKPKWENTRLSAIQPQDIQKLHTKMGTENGKYMANRVRSLLSGMYSNAKSLMGWEGANPAKGVEPFEEVTRERYLQATELPNFFEALKKEPNPVLRTFFLFCLFTGQRRGVCAKVKWSDLNLQSRTWEVEGIKTKTGQPVVVPLAPELIAALEELQGELNEKHPGVEYEYVFPAMRKGKLGTEHMTDPMRAWRRLLKNAGLENVRIHDLRRSMGSWQANGGASLQIIGKTLGHNDPQATMIYARLQIDPVRQEVTKAVKAMCEAGKFKLPASKSKVKPRKKAAE
jgi:integrase